MASRHTKTVAIACLLFALLAMSSAQYPRGRGNNRRNPYRRQNNTRNRDRRSGDDGDRHRRQNNRSPRSTECGSFKNACCQPSTGKPPCNPGLTCMLLGNSKWRSGIPRCTVPKPKRRGKGKGKGKGKGRKRGKQPRPQIPYMPDAMDGQSVGELSGWVLVIVRANGKKCFSRVKSYVSASVQNEGEGTFAEVFGDLSGSGWCEEGAKGFGIGWIRADVLAGATKIDDECVADVTTNIESGTRIRGTGIGIETGGTVGGSAGTVD